MSISISKRKLRSFGFIVGLLFPLLIGFIFPIIAGHNFRIWTLYIGISLVILALVSPKILRIPFEIWMKIGNFLGFINSRIILGSIALIMKIIGYDPLKRKFNKEKSYREFRKNDKINIEEIF